MLAESRVGNGMAEGEGTLAGSRVGAYQLGELIGAGQLAEVYQAQHPAMPQPVALKIFMPGVAFTLRKEFSELHRLPSLWTRSCFASTAGNVSSETVQRYIEAQSRQ
jgi:serine/threonine protein kinase